MSHVTFAMWSAVCTCAIILVVYLLGAPLYWWWTFPVGGLVGFTFGRLKRRFGQ